MNGLAWQVGPKSSANTSVLSLAGCVGVSFSSLVLDDTQRGSPSGYLRNTVSRTRAMLKCGKYSVLR